MTWFTPIIDNAMEFAVTFLQWAVVAACYAALLAVVAMLVNVLLRRWMTAAQMGLLWALVLVRLILPYGPASSFSLASIVEKATDVFQSPAPNGLLTVEQYVSQPRTTTSYAETPAVQANSAPNAPTNLLYDNAPQSTDRSGDAADVSANNALNHTESWWEIVCTFVIVAVWPLGSIVVLASNVFFNWRFSRTVRQISVCSDQRILSLWNVSRSLAGVRKVIPVVLFDAIRQPAVTGAIRPILLLPSDTVQLSDEQLQMIMLHELAHVRRFDVAFNWLLVVIRAIHWWNPVYWLAAARFCNLREQACDTFVIRRLHGQSVHGYGDLLLEMAQRSPAPGRWRVMLPASMLSFISSALRRRSLGNRLKVLPAAAIARGRWQKLAVAGLFVLLVCCGWTVAKTNSSGDDQDQGKSVLPLAFEQIDCVEAAKQSSDQTPVSRDYDVGAVLAAMVGEDRTLAQARTDFDSFLIWEFQQRPALAAGTTSGVPVVDKDVESFDPKNKPTNLELSAQYSFDGRHLHLTATTQRHDEFAKQLHVWEQGGQTQICVECRFVTMNSRSKSTVDIPWRCLAPFSEGPDEPPQSDLSPNKLAFRATARVEEYVPVVYAVLDAAKTRAFANESQNNPRTNILQAPKVTCFNGQEFTISDLKQEPFVVAVHEISPGVQTPKISVIAAGTKITLRPVYRAGDSCTQLTGRMEMSSVAQVQTANIKSRDSTAEPTAVQVPRVKRCLIDIASEIPSGHSLLIGSLPDDNADNNLYLLLTPTIIK